MPTQSPRKFSSTRKGSRASPVGGSRSPRWFQFQPLWHEICRTDPDLFFQPHPLAGSRWAGAVRVRAACHLDTASPEALFVLSAIAQYTGTSIAARAPLRRDRPACRLSRNATAVRRSCRRRRAGATCSPWLDPQSVRPCSAVRHDHRPMNTCFYMALADTDLGTSVAIEFIGPMTSPLLSTRTTRNAFALGLAAIGVRRARRAGGRRQHDRSPWLLAASAMWAAYIVLGSRVARLDRGVSGLGVGMAVGAVVLLPIGVPGSAHVLATPRLLIACLVVGVCSNAIGYGIDQHVLRLSLCVDSRCCSPCCRSRPSPSAGSSSASARRSSRRWASASCSLASSSRKRDELPRESDDVEPS